MVRWRPEELHAAARLHGGGPLQRHLHEGGLEVSLRTRIHQARRLSDLPLPAGGHIKSYSKLGIINYYSLFFIFFIFLTISSKKPKK